MSKIYTKLNFLVFGIVILLFTLKTFVFKKKENMKDKLSHKNEIKKEKIKNEENKTNKKNLLKSYKKLLTF